MRPGGDTWTIADYDRVQEEACKDDYQLLRERVSAGDWADNKDAEPLALQPFYRMRLNLPCQGDVVTYCSDEGH